MLLITVMKKSTFKQLNLFNQKTKNGLSYGGELRKTRSGRKARPLSSKDSHHIVFKLNRDNLLNKGIRHPKNFSFIQSILTRYSRKFFIKIEKISYQHGHIHIIARTSRRSNLHNFFRVFSGQIAQNLKNNKPAGKVMVTDTHNGAIIAVNDVNNTQVKQRNRTNKKISLWRHRPFTRIVKGWKNYLTLQNYIQLNEKEVTGVIPYRKERLKGLSMIEWEKLWS